MTEGTPGPANHNSFVPSKLPASLVSAPEGIRKPSTLQRRLRAAIQAEGSRRPSELCRSTHQPHGPSTRRSNQARSAAVSLDGGRPMTPTVVMPASPGWATSMNAGLLRGRSHLHAARHLDPLPVAGGRQGAYAIHPIDKPPCFRSSPRTSSFGRGSSCATPPDRHRPHAFRRAPQHPPFNLRQPSSRPRAQHPDKPARVLAVPLALNELERLPQRIGRGGLPTKRAAVFERQASL